MAALVIGVTPASAILYRVKPGHWVSYEARQGKPTPHTSPKSMRLSASSNFEIFNGSLGYLNYSGGPVMSRSTNYVFVWNGSNYTGSPFGSGSNCGFADGSGNYNTPCSSYVSGVNTYFQDLAAASGTSGNSNAVSTQYNDAAGHSVNYDVSAGGIINDTNPFPTSGCTGAPGGGLPGRCLTDQQVQNELQSYLSAHGYPAGMTNEYFVLTPPDVASCFDAGGSVCSGNAGPGGTPYFCAYHSTTNTTSHYIYSNIPDMDDINGCDPFASDSPADQTDCSFYTCVWPNGWADGVLSAVSHEHNESLTDPQPNNAWADWSGGPRPMGDENGDKCNFDAGDDPNRQWHETPNTYGLEGTPYNETINGRAYYVQREWSNEDMSCKSSYSASPAPGATFTAHTVSGRTVSFNASGSGGGIAQYVWQFNDGPGGSQVQTVKTTSPTISHTFPSAGIYTVALTTMAGNGRSRGTAKAVDVAPPVISLVTIPTGQTVRSMINNGFKISSHLSEAGTEKGILKISATKAQQLGIPQQIGTGALSFTAAATKTMTMNLTTQAKNKLANQSNLVVTATLNATDKAGNKAAPKSKSATLPH